MRRAVLWTWIVASVGASPLAPRAASACENDSDAARMERKRPDDVIAVVSGKYVRHSPAWLEWRVRDRLGRLAALDAADLAAPADAEALRTRLGLLDDLGVAYDRLGRHDEAIAVGRRALDLDGRRYESLTNLGTYLAHAGRVPEGLPLLRTAIEVDPKAHFGRARYEIAYFEYRESRRRDGAVALPLFVPRAGAARGIGFPAFLAERRTPAGAAVEPLSSGERADALRGVVGLLFSSRNDDAALLEVLGHVLVDPNAPAEASPTARLLAARAYLAAADAVGTEHGKTTYRALARGVLVPGSATGAAPIVEFGEIEDAYVDERFVGQRFTEELAREEASLLATAGDPEAAFVARYLVPGPLEIPSDVWPRERASSPRGARAPVAAAVATLPDPSPAADLPTPSVPLLLPLGIVGLLVVAGVLHLGAERRARARRSHRRRRPHVARLSFALRPSAVRPTMSRPRARAS